MTKKVYGHNYRFPSTEGYTRFFSIYTQYPDSARKLHLEGAVVLQFQVDEKGVPSGFTFMSSPHPVFETELLRCAPNMPKCVPAHYHKRPTKTIVNQTIFFELIDI
jgi:TonB family protein